MKIIYLHPESTFRTKLRSDTLWGIICWAIRNVYGNDELENLLKTYTAGKPEFIISSTFPFFEIEGKKYHFLPKPNLPETYIEQDAVPRKTKIQNAKNRKKLKKVQQLELTDYVTFISQPKKTQDIIQNIAFGEQKNTLLIKSDSIPHNTINRLHGGTLKLKNESGQLFHVDEYYFQLISEKKEDSFDIDEPKGLFFLVKGNTEKLEGALRFLNHIGYGGDRNTGKGKFYYEIKDFNIQEPEDYNAVTNLSLYYPTEDEIKQFKGNPLFNYQIEERQGFLGFNNNYNNSLKPITSMFVEGSVFPKIDQEFYGQNKIVIPKSEKIDHNVFQFGYGFMIKIKI